MCVCADRDVTISNRDITIADRDEVGNHDRRFSMIADVWLNQLPWPHARLERCVLAPVAGFMTKYDA